MDLTEAIGDGGRPVDSTHTTQTVSTKIMSLKNKGAAVKRRITNTLKKLDSTTLYCTIWTESYNSWLCKQPARISHRSERP